MQSNSEKHQDLRKECWISAFAGCSSSIGANRPSIAISWADIALKEFDARFPAPVEDRMRTKNGLGYTSTLSLGEILTDPGV